MNVRRHRTLSKGVVRGPLLIVLSGPSGTGKTTLARRLCRQNANVVQSVSVTTRAPKKGERNGRDYCFVSVEEFRRLKKKKALLESARVFRQYYGTPGDQILKHHRNGKDVLVAIDVQGAAQIRRRCPESIHVFLAPPSVSVLRERLARRSRDTADEMSLRLEVAKEELSRMAEYDYVVVNDQLSVAVAKLRSIVIAERCRVKG
ncbi:MAG: guanylate kinase [Candidatus Omnitrophica bacterium]|nr:guanylate kinase [Candidatus Omnitrophota bacterium]